MVGPPFDRQECRKTVHCNAKIRAKIRDYALSAKKTQDVRSTIK